MPVELLDYPDSEIRMIVETQLERTKRITACQKEPETLEWLRTLEAGDLLFDIGACCGSYSLIAASRGLKVVAFEPAPFNVSRMRENFQLNNMKIPIMQCAVGRQTGRCSMLWSSDEPGAASHQMTEGTDIRVMALDDFPAQPDHCKIDVDGSELEVVQGGRAVWDKVKSVQIEIDDSLPNWKEVVEILEASGLCLEKWTRHGSTSVSNVLFKREAGDAAA